MSNEINTPDYESLQYKTMKDDIKLNRDVSGGQDKLRTKEYLAQYEGESTQGYKDRVATSYLNNKLNEKISTSTGLILNKRIQGENLPDYMLDDIDGAGSTLDQFSLMLLTNGEIDGHSFIVVDSQTEEGLSQGQEEALNIHPYWMNIEASCVINWKVSNVSGNTMLTQATIRESVIEDNGRFGEESVNQLKVYNLVIDEMENAGVYYELWREIDGAYSVYQEMTKTSFTEIPLIPFYANRVSNMLSRPPYMNVTNNTINAFQLSSQKNRAIKMVADPDKAVFSTDLQSKLQQDSLNDDSGVAQSALTFGADIAQVFATEDDYKYIEPTGKGVELLAKEIERIENFVDGIGAELNVRTNMTATQAEIKNTQATAEDVIFSMNLEVALNRAIEITKQVDSKIQEDATIELNRDFAKSQLNDSTITALNAMVLNGNLSKEALLKSISTGELPKFISDEELMEEIEKIERETMGIE